MPYLHTITYRIAYDEKSVKKNLIPQDLLKAAQSPRQMFAIHPTRIEEETVRAALKRLPQLYSLSRYPLTFVVETVKTHDAYGDPKTGRSIFDSLVR